MDAVVGVWDRPHSQELQYIPGIYLSGLWTGFHRTSKFWRLPIRLLAGWGSGSYNLPQVSSTHGCWLLAGVRVHPPEFGATPKDWDEESLESRRLPR